MAKGKKKNFSEQFLITDSSGKIEKMLTNKRQEIIYIKYEVVIQEFAPLYFFCEGYFRFSVIRCSCTPYIRAVIMLFC